MFSGTASSNRFRQKRSDNTSQTRIKASNHRRTIQFKTEMEIDQRNSESVEATRATTKREIVKSHLLHLERYNASSSSSHLWRDTCDWYIGFFFLNLLVAIYRKWYRPKNKKAGILPTYFYHFGRRRTSEDGFAEEERRHAQQDG